MYSKTSFSSWFSFWIFLSDEQSCTASDASDPIMVLSTYILRLKSHNFSGGPQLSVSVRQLYYHHLFFLPVPATCDHEDDGPHACFARIVESLIL